MYTQTIEEEAHKRLQKLSIIPKEEYEEVKEQAENTLLFRKLCLTISVERAKQELLNSFRR